MALSSSSSSDAHNSNSNSNSISNSDDERVSTLIIGSGPTGLGSAIRLTQVSNSRNWLVIDREISKVGGLSQSDITDEGFIFDLGGHVIFSHYDFFDKLLDQALNDQEQWQVHQRVSYARYKQEWVPYPFQNNLFKVPVDDQIFCINGLIEAKVKSAVGYASNRPANFDDWILRTMGKGLADIFMRPYNLKVWGYPPATMQSDWLGDRVSVVNVEKVIENILRGKEDTSWGPNAVFRFPTNGGTGSIWEEVYKQIPNDCKRKGCEVVAIYPKEKYVEIIDLLDSNSNNNSSKNGNEIKALDGGNHNHSLKNDENENEDEMNSKVSKDAVENINQKKRHIDDVDSSSSTKTKTKKIYYDNLITTMPLDICLRSLKGLDTDELNKADEWASKLVHSSTHIIGIGFRGENPHGKKCWLYFPESICPFYRATVFSNYGPGNCPPETKLLPTIRIIGKEEENDNKNKSIGYESKPGPYWSLMLEVVETDYLNKGITSNEVIEQCIKGCIATSLAKQGDEIVSIYHRRIDYGYPTPSLHRDDALKEALPYLDSFNIYSRGRFGSFKYEIGNQDHSVALGVEVVDRILFGKEEVTLHNPNEVNKPGGVKNQQPKYCLGKWQLDDDDEDKADHSQ